MMMIQCGLKNAGICQGYNIVLISTEEHSAFCWLSVVNYYYNIYLEQLQKPVMILGVFTDIQTEHFPKKNQKHYH
jgi:hypothetical protein